MTTARTGRGCTWWRNTTESRQKYKRQSFDESARRWKFSDEILWKFSKDRDWATGLLASLRYQWRPVKMSNKRSHAVKIQIENLICWKYYSFLTAANCPELRRRKVRYEVIWFKSANSKDSETGSRNICFETFLIVKCFWNFCFENLDKICVNSKPLEYCERTQ